MTEPITLVNSEAVNGDGSRVRTLVEYWPAPLVVPPSMVLGSSNITNDAGVSIYNNRYGPLMARRWYNSGMPTSMPVNIDNDRVSVWSFKPDMAAVSAGQLYGNLRALVASVPPRTKPLYMIIGHEMEPAINDGRWTAGHQYSATVRWHDIVMEAGRPELIPAVCFAGTQQLDGQTKRRRGYDVGDTVPTLGEAPGLAVVFDAYNRWPARQDNGQQYAWTTFEERFTRQVAWSAAEGFPWLVGETNCHEGVEPSTKAQWTRDAVMWAEANGCRVFCWWDRGFSDGTDLAPSARLLNSSPEHVAVWFELNSARQ